MTRDYNYRVPPGPEYGMFFSRLRIFRESMRRDGLQVGYVRCPACHAARAVELKFRTMHKLRAECTKCTFKGME